MDIFKSKEKKIIEIQAEIDAWETVYGKWQPPLYALENLKELYTKLNKLKPKK